MRPVKPVFSRCGFTLALFLLFVFLAVSPAPADDWLPIPPDDLALKDNLKQPGANAMILFRQSTINAVHANTDGDYVEEYVRIKIFTQEGTKEADREVEFVKGESDIKDVRARTIHPDGTIVPFDGKTYEKTVVKLSGIKFLAKTFTLPDVQPGCIIEYKYRRQHKPELLYDSDWTISGPLYTREAHFAIFPYTRPDSPQLSYRQYGLPVKTVPERQPDGSYKMAVHDIPAIDEEAFMPPVKAISARVEFYYRDASDPTDETVEHFWNRIGKRMNDNFESYINKKGTLEKELARTVSAGDSPEEKLRKIYARVQQIRDLGLESAKSEKERKQENLKSNSNVDDLLKHGYGNGREIDYLFVGLARAAGFEATEVYITSRDRNLFFPQMQDPRQLNDDVVWVRAAGKEYWLDPAARYFPFGLLPWYETDVAGLRLNKQGGEFVTVPPSASSDAMLARHADLEITGDGSAKGKLEIDFNGQRGALLRLDNHEADEAARRKILTDEIGSWLPADASFEITTIANWEKPDQPLRVEGALTMPGLGVPTGKRILVPLSIFHSPDMKAFASAHRSNNIYFHFPYEETDDLRIHPPSGFRIESVPPAKQHHPGAASYDIQASQDGSDFEVKRHLVIGGVVFPKDSYRPLQFFFNSVKTDDESQASLQRSESAKN